MIADEEYPILVPAGDTDGNDRAGVRAPMVAAPLGTYVGWNLRRPELGRGAMVGITGSYIPLTETEDERMRTGDPRASVLERYPSAAAYVSAIRQAAEALVRDGLMLEEDVERAVAGAAGWGRSRHTVSLPTDPAT